MAATESALRSLLTELFPHAAADVVLKENLIHLGGFYYGCCISFPPLSALVDEIFR